MVGRAKAGVAFMAPSAIRCDRLAERDSNARKAYSEADRSSNARKENKQRKKEAKKENKKRKKYTLDSELQIDIQSLELGVREF